MMGIGILFGATSQAGATSTAGTATSVTTSSTYVTGITSNHNGYEVGVEYQPQKLVSGKWVNLDWYAYNFVSPNKKVKDQELKKNFSKGTFRYVVKVDKFDKKGNAITAGKYFTATFKIN